MMKWVGLIFALGLSILIATRLKNKPGETSKILIAMGFLPFAVGHFHLYMAPISWAMWPGYVKGIEFSLIDALALGLYFGQRRASTSVPLRLLMGIYLAAAVLSVSQASQPMAALFYGWQLLRMYVVYSVIATACRDSGNVLPVLKGMVVGLVMEAGVAIWERFGMGQVQAGGTLGHQNLLGLMSHFVVFPFFALLLSGRGGALPAFAVAVGLVVEVLTTSRATVGLAAAGYALVFLMSSVRGWSSRKTIVLVLGCATIITIVPFAMSSFDRRFALEGSSSYDERAAFEKAAAMMLFDHPLGVGANHYVIAANTGGYNERAGVAPVSGSESANVHNLYWLVAVETGYFGLAAAVPVLLAPLFLSFRCGWKLRNDGRGDLMIGLGTSLVIVYVHSLFEWILITFQAQYMLAIEIGIIAGMYAHCRRRSMQPQTHASSTVLAIGTSLSRDGRASRQTTDKI